MMSSSQLVHQPQRMAGGETASGFQTARWGEAIGEGFQILPNVLFRAQRHLGLDSSDVVILVNLAMHWWGPGALPYPSPAILANRMGLSKRTIERRFVRLQGLGYIERLPAESDGKRRFELKGLVDKLESSAKQGLAQREPSKRRANRAL